METIRATVVIEGDVQGVFFRGTARMEAIRLGVTGWIGNRMDGAVEAVFEGERPAVEQMVAWCHVGPPRAEVARVNLTYSSATGEFSRFSVV